ncbi:aminoglycoside phosphotransferase family protein [Microbacterium koreense]|uniref:Aminoglycoside phosphotransferase family protein n=1 Tax=Microbacterium koreense TaxID=323761 RepID=A0ABW2ZRV3_9MICO
MPNKPAAQVRIDAQLVRRLLSGIPGTDELPLVHADDGWDCSMWRLGHGLAVRLPRRPEAVPLLAHEAQALAEVGGMIEATGIRVPTPIHSGAPAAGFPWPWMIVRWIDGCRGLDIARTERTLWAGSLAQALRALHRPARSGYPVNPVRGGPLTDRAEVVARRFSRARDADAVDPATLDVAEHAWREALSSPAWRGAAVWIHGDLHPGNVIAQGGSLRGIIDFGDATAGDPAYDLAIAWLAFDAAGRAAFTEAMPHVDRDTWLRSRGWAAAIAVLLLDNSDDAPAYARLAHEALAEIATPETRRLQTRSAAHSAESPVEDGDPR